MRMQDFYFNWAPESCYMDKAYDRFSTENSMLGYYKERQQVQAICSSGRKTMSYSR